ncbi:class I SAM-dependent methyltransferase [Arsukibacterium sp.]|uniref:class I SAM-dependent methyltransferase n=1 Tax=Arsukibacterium sp. TaxID=1977258 RepID=UPI00299DC3A4|nr:class I SAM-dependent methyltransferase [Arsukibacterium sp.]MDX1537756.1 class I SAM-dependent methyltransferase [Arsukibacterium sp.]
MSKTVDIYHQGAALFAAQYDALSFEQVHACWQQFWPQTGPEQQLVLDIGAGSGRDAMWLAGQGCQVIAVEPAEDLLRLGQLKTDAQAAPENQQKIQWLQDSLPELKACYQLNLQFNTILLSAVWMHVLPSERERAFRKITNLLAPGGRFVLSLRFGDFSDERAAYPVSVDEVAALARQFGLVLRFVSETTADAGGRAGVSWQTLVLELPDDGSS